MGEDTECGTLWLIKATKGLRGRINLVFDRMQLKSLIELSIAAELIKEREIYNKAEEDMRFPIG